MAADRQDDDSQDYVEEDLCADETDSRQDPGPHGNDLELSREY